MTDAIAPAKKYSRPPITEAVINFRFEPAADRADAERIGRAVSSRYPNAREERETEVELQPGKEPKVSDSWVGLRFSSHDETEILIVRRNDFIVARLAPYVGFESLRSRAVADWRDLLKVLGRRPKLTHTGLKYLNRIDIPTDGTAEGSIRLGAYVTLEPRLPAVSTAPMFNFRFHAAQSLGHEDLVLVVSCATVPSPVPNHRSIGLDIDVLKQKDLPASDDGLWALVDMLRLEKNRVFEASITDQARALFS